MSITATVHIEHELLALVPTLRRLDGVSIRVITQGNTDPESAVFPFFVEYDDRAELERALEDDPTVDAYQLVDWMGGTGIYYIEHADEVRLISTAVTDANGFLIHTETKGNGWLVRLMLPDREALNVVWTYAKERNISMDIVEVYGNRDTNDEVSYGLTDEQAVALRTAYENGYFSEPREISLNDAADEIGLSSTAMSGRLRRGMRNLISTTIAEK